MTHKIKMRLTKLDERLKKLTMTAETTQPEKVSRLERLEKKILELQRQKKILEYNENKKQRNARTRRLIQIGAIALQYLSCPKDITPKEFEELLKNWIAKKA